MNKTLLFILFIIVGCSSSSRTKYRPFEKDEGFRDEILQNDLRVVNFKANPYTNKFDVELFAKFRAIEVCRENQTRIASFIEFNDKTQAREVTRTTTNGYPSYYYGMSPFYSRYSSFGFGFSTMQSNTWNETYIYPEIEIFYYCTNTVFDPGLVLREVSAEELKHLVKDLKGGLQIEGFTPESPNNNILRKGDIVLKVNGERVQSLHELFLPFKNNQNVTVELLREGNKKTYTLKSTDISNKVEETQEEIVQGVCRKKEFDERAICK